MAEKLSVVMARKHLEAADVALMVIDAVEGVTASDATIAGYAHESGRSVIVVINKWDLVTDGAHRWQAAGRPQHLRRAGAAASEVPVLRAGGVCLRDDGQEISTSSFRRWSWWRASAASASAPAR